MSPPSLCSSMDTSSTRLRSSLCSSFHCLRYRESYTYTRSSGRQHKDYPKQIVNLSVRTFPLPLRSSQRSTLETAIQQDTQPRLRDTLAISRSELASVTKISSSCISAASFTTSAKSDFRPGYSKSRVC